MLDMVAGLLDDPLAAFAQQKIGIFTGDLILELPARYA